MSLALVLLAWWFWPRSITNLRPQSGPVVFLGDSISAGTGSQTGRGYVAILAQRTGLELINKGVPGDTTVSALKRLDEDVLSLKPALVIVQLGGNDFLQRLPQDETFANLETIIERIQQQGGAVLLLGMQSGIFGDKAAARYRELARAKKTGFVKNLLDGILTRADLKADSIHPNDLGYERVADRVEPELRWMLRKLGKL